MPIIIKRPCLWCGQMIDTKRSHTRLHGGCHMPMHRMRQKLMPGDSPTVFFQFIENELKEGRHPNKKHPIHNQEEVKENESSISI